MRNDVVLSVDKVSAAYGDVQVLDHVSLSVRAGRVHALIGTNGSGKSTLYKTIMGLKEPTSGAVSTPLRAPGAIAYVPQSEAVDWHFPLNVREVVEAGRFAGPRWFSRLNAEDRKRVEAALSRTGMTEFAQRQIGALSGGQRKRAFVARGIAQGAQLMLLDEPFAGVDVSNQLAITSLLRELASDGIGILVTTHDLDHVGDLADDVTLLNHRVIASGSLDEVMTEDNLRQAFGGAVC